METTREQLIARWDTETGQALARDVLQALSPKLLPRVEKTLTPEESARDFVQRAIAWQQVKVAPLGEEIKQRLTALPFANEVAPHLDLRGLHVEGQEVYLSSVDLSGARLDYVYEIGNVSRCIMVKTVFDGCRAVQASFSRETLHEASFVEAVLNGVNFYQADLSGAIFQRAQMVTTELVEATCTQASFTGADLRFADCWHADFRGADLREVNFTEANLGDIVFDEHTRLHGANLRGASLNREFRVFAQEAGALLGESHKEREIAELDATLKLMTARNEDGHLDGALRQVRIVREHLAQNPDYQWSYAIDEALKREGSPELVDEVLDMVVEAGKALAAFI